VKGQSTKNPVVERRLTIGVAIVTAVISLPLFALAARLAIAALSHPEPAQGILLTSFPLTFALFLAIVSWRGFASVNEMGAAISPRGWRLVAAFFLALGVVFGFAHWLGAVLPFAVACISLLGDPKVVAWLQRVGFVR